MMFKCKLYDSAASVWVNPEHIIYAKYHPSDDNPLCGYIVLRERPLPVYVDLSDFARLLEAVVANDDPTLQQAKRS